jgi:hypothetical protein
MKLLFIRRQDNPRKGVYLEMGCVPRKGEEVFFQGETLKVREVKYFIDTVGLEEAHYKKNVPFVRIVFELF